MKTNESNFAFICFRQLAFASSEFPLWLYPWPRSAVLIHRLHCGRIGDMVRVRPQPIRVAMPDSLRVRDHVLPIFPAMDPLRSNRRLAMAPGDVEHIGRRRQPGET